MKFKIGDKVKVIKNNLSNRYRAYCLGEIGVVTDYKTYLTVQFSDGAYLCVIYPKDCFEKVKDEDQINHPLTKIFK
jgi:hypothetical protein